jgi:hypothetical protein
MEWGMRHRAGLVHVLAMAALFAGAPAWANSINQNTSWTIDRAGTSAKFRVVAYGDSWGLSVFNPATP